MYSDKFFVLGTGFPSKRKSIDLMVAGPKPLLRTKRPKTGAEEAQFPKPIYNSGLLPIKNENTATKRAKKAITIAILSHITRPEPFFLFVAIGLFILISLELDRVNKYLAGIAAKDKFGNHIQILQICGSKIT
jgi:hypothetical protein